MKLRKIAKHYLAGIKHHRKKKTHKSYKQRLANLLEKFGHREFSSITFVEIERYIRKLSKKICPWTGKPYSNSTMHHEITQIQAIHSFALRRQILKKPILIAKLEKPPVGKRKFIPTEAQIEQLLNEAARRPDFIRLFRSLEACGARPGELCSALIERDIDRKTQEIVLEDHKTRGKTGEPRRIPIGPALEPLLKEAIGDRTEGPVFLTDRGCQWTPEGASALQRKFRRRADLPDEFVLYCTRHLFVTRLIKAGVPEAKVALLVGHKPGSPMTLGTYSHLENDEEIRNLQALAVRPAVVPAVTAG